MKGIIPNEYEKSNRREDITSTKDSMVNANNYYHFSISLRITRCLSSSSSF